MKRLLIVAGLLAIGLSAIPRANGGTATPINLGFTAYSSPAGKVKAVTSHDTINLSAAGGHIIQNNGSSLPARAFLNFTGAIQATDAGGKTAISAPRLDTITKNVLDYGAKGDAVYGYDGAITSGTAVFTSSSITFTSSDVGKKIIIDQAGSTTLNLETSIASINSAHSVNLANNAGATVSGVEFVYGTDDRAAIQAIITANAAQRPYALNVLGAPKPVRLLFPPQHNYMIWGTPGQHYGLYINTVDDVEMMGGGSLVFPDIACIASTNARFLNIHDLNFDGMQFNKMKASPTYSAAIWQQGAEVNWWTKQRDHLYQHNHISRVKYGIGNDGSYSGVNTQMVDNQIDIFHVLGSIAINPQTSDNKVKGNVISNANIGIYAAYDIPSCIGNHTFNTGGYGIIYAKGHTTSGSNVVTIDTIDSALTAQWAHNVGVYVQVSSGLPSSSTWYKITAAGTGPTTLTLDTAATSTTSANSTIITSYGMDYGLYIPSGGGPVTCIGNEFDQVSKSIIYIIDPTNPVNLSHNGFLNNWFPDAKYITVDSATPGTAVNDVIITNNEFKYTGSLYNPNVPIVTIGANVDQNASGDFIIDDNLVPASSSGDVYEVFRPSGYGLDMPDAVIDINADAYNGLDAFHVESSNDKAKVGLYNFGAQYTTPAFRGFKAGGTPTSPTATVSGDYLFSLSGYGWDGSAWQQAATMRYLTAENFSLGHKGTKIGFFVTPVGGSLDNTPSVEIGSDQMLRFNVVGKGIAFQDGTTQTTAGVSFPTQTGNSGKFLTTNGTSTSWGAIPVGSTNGGNFYPFLDNGGGTTLYTQAAHTLYYDGTALTWNTPNLTASGVVTGGSLVGPWTTTDDTTTNSTYYPLFQVGTGGANLAKTSSSKLTYNPSTGLLTSTGMSAATGTWGSGKVTENSIGIGVGAASPNADIYILNTSDGSGGAGTERGYEIEHVNDISNGQLLFRHAKGTPGSKTAVASTSSLGVINWMGWDGSAYTPPASINVLVNGTVAGGSVPSDMVFKVGASSNGTERLRLLGADGRLRISGQPSAPANNATCTAGDMILDAANGFLYLCTSTNSWKRASFAAY